MENRNEAQICEIVNDLLPLYADNACSESSKAMVEEHIQTCGACKSLLEAMQSPLELAAPEEVEELPVVRALKKLRRSVWKQTIAMVAIVLAVVMLALVGSGGLSLYHHLTGSGLCFDNQDEVERCERLLETWKNDGAEAMVEQLDASMIYEDITSEHFSTKATWKSSASEQAFQEEYYGYTNPFGWEDSEFVELKVGDDTYMVTRAFYYYITAEIPGLEVQVEEQNALENGDTDAFWYALITGDDTDFLLPGALFDELEERYEGLEETKAYGYPIRRMSTQWGEYVYRYNEGALYLYPETLPEDMQEKTGCPETLDTLYLMIGQTDIITPELYAYYHEVQEQVKGWYKTYQRYYEDMDTEAFETQWKADVVSALTALEAQWGKMTEYQFNSIFRTGSSQHGSGWRSGNGWRSIWWVTFENGRNLSITLYTPAEGKSVIYHITDYNTNASQSEQQCLSELSQALTVVPDWPMAL